MAILLKAIYRIQWNTHQKSQCHSSQKYKNQPQINLEEQKIRNSQSNPEQKEQC
jgi:hypothetical protein